jgi:general stress protein 26
MSNGARAEDATQDRLWEAIETRRVGMLSLTKSGLHPQPMIAFVERRRRRLWFIARSDTDLVRTIGEGGACMFAMQDGELLASVAGELSVVQDRRRMARCWNAKVADWLPEGLDDPKLTMLRLDCVDAELWVSGFGLTKFAWEIGWTGPYPQIPALAGRAVATLH